MFNLCCDLELEHRNSVFALDPSARNGVPLTYVCLQKEQQVRRYSRNSLILNLTLTVTMKIANRFLLFLIMHHRTIFG